MKNKKIMDTYDTCGPSEEIKQSMLQHIMEEANGDFQKERRGNMKKFAAALITIILVLSTSIVGYAAYKWLSADEVAVLLDDKKLAEEFGKKRSEIQSVRWKEYEIAYIGIVSGKNISSFENSDRDRSYAVVAIGRIDGKEIKEPTRSFLVTPFIQGLKPWQHNIYTFGGGANGIAKDGIFYWMMECESIEKFADKEVYLAVMGGSGIGDLANAYQYHDDTGRISQNDNYNGLNLLFSVELDKSKADPNAVKQYMDDLEKEFNDTKSTEEETSKADQMGIVPI